MSLEDLFRTITFIVVLICLMQIPSLVSWWSSRDREKNGSRLSTNITSYSGVWHMGGLKRKVKRDRRGDDLQNGRK